MTRSEKNTAWKAIHSRAPVAISVTATLLILLWVLNIAFYSINPSDEFFFLLTMENPFLNDFTYPATLSHFFYHPVYQALGGNILALRWFAALSYFLLAWALAAIYLKSITSNSAVRGVTLHVISAGLATASFALFAIDGWRPPLVPSYHSLTFCALMIVSIGLLLTNKNATKARIVGLIMVGIGGWLTVIGKPSSASLLAPVVLVYIFFAHKNPLRTLILPVVVAFSLWYLSILVVSGSIPNYIERMLIGLELTRVLDVGHTLRTIFLIDLFSALIKKHGALLASWLLFITSSLLLPRSKNRLIISGSLAFLLLLQVIAIVVNLHTKSYEGVGSGKAVSLLVLVASLTTIFPPGRDLALRMFYYIKKAFLSKDKNMHIEILFLVAPLIIALGTNQPYRIEALRYSFFWVLCIPKLMMALPFKTKPISLENKLWFATIAFQTLLATYIGYMANTPVEQPTPIRLNKAVVTDVPKISPRLVLSDEHALAIRNMIENTKNVDFKPGTPLINLAGHVPIVTYLLNARSVGHPQYINGLPTSTKFAKQTLAQSPCKDVVNAWLLVAEYTHLSDVINVPLVLSHFGIKFPDDYRRAASWQTPYGADYKNPIEYTLYEPITTPKCP